MRALSWMLGLWLAGAAAAQARDLADMSSAEITVLQQRLTDGACYHGAVDGQASPALDAAIKECPSQDPILRIETGMHTAQISQVGVDRDCRLACQRPTGSRPRCGCSPKCSVSAAKRKWPAHARNRRET
ncbi:MAG: hypothetical protein ABSA68_19870 [Xanthobacteraceae bacterium]|jgi:hypothetical protein